MRIVLTIVIFTIAIPIFTAAQTPGYYLIYGNRDGSTIDVYLDSDIEIKGWISTPFDENLCDIDCNGIIDSINFMHIPLASNDSIIISRNSGALYNLLIQWDNVDFMPPDTNSPVFGYTNQSLLAFADLGGAPNTYLNTEGDTVLFFSFYMRTTQDSSYLGQTVCPFQEGYNPANGDLLCGMQDGATPIIPLQTFPCLNFVDYLAGDANGSVNYYLSGLLFQRCGAATRSVARGRRQWRLPGKRAGCRIPCGFL